MARLAISLSRGIRNIVGIEHLLAVDRVIAPSDPWSYSDEVTVAVWGRKNSAKQAIRYADKLNLPVVYLEDGFIRSCSRDPHSRLTYSLVADSLGVYYDSEYPSELESMLNLPNQKFDKNFGGIEIELTQACLELMTEFQVTKYNYCKDYAPPVRPSDSSVVVVVDQTYGDASVSAGAMDQNRFQLMLDCAIAENPGSIIVVKTHPDVVAGIKKGYLTHYARKLGVEIIGEAVNPFGVIKNCDRVYVGTSQFGMEALMCQKPVTVFGKPFYAGWGLTDDRSDFSNRTANRSLIELFFAVYMWYPRYCNPVTGEVWSLPECLEHVILQKRQFARNAKHYRCVGITPWKRKYIENYLRSPDGTVSFSSNLTKPKRTTFQNCEEIVTWGYKTIKQNFVLDVPVTRIEDGFLRSQGLGSDFNAPSSLVLDSSGLYFNPKSRSELENLLNYSECNLDHVWRSRRLINLILSAKLSKYNLGGSEKHDWSSISGGRTILVVGQVETDDSINFGCNSITTNEQLLKAVRKNCPDASIIYKPHPDVEAGNRPGKVAENSLKSIVDLVISDTDIISCIDAADELHTMTSLTGFEALLRGKKVVTYGMPFYAGWGLTQDMESNLARIRSRTLEELVYFSLIAYPTYMDFKTGEFISPENLIRIISCKTMNNKNMAWPERQYTKLVNVYKGLTYES